VNIQMLSKMIKMGRFSKLPWVTTLHTAVIACTILL